MNTLVQIGLTNAVVASALAVLAAVVGKLARRPALSHALWMLVLIKLVTPPLIVIPIALPQSTEESEPQVIAEASPQPVVAEPTPIPPQQNGDIPVAEPKVWRAKPTETRDPAEPAEAALQQPLDARPPCPAQAEYPAGEPAEEELAWSLPELPWLTMIGVLWAGGSVCWFSLALVRIRRFRRVLRTAQVAPAVLRREASELAARMGLRDCPGVWLVPGVVSPLLWALVGVPRLLVPVALLGRLDDLQRRTLLAHELAHYRRRDHWVRCLEFLALGIYWWFPVVWWARRELREAEEECCDAWVMWTLPEASKAYASALVETLDFLSGSQQTLPSVASGMGQLDLLRRRLIMIMRGTKPRKLGGLGFLAVLGLAVLLLPLAPTGAQQNQGNGGPFDPSAAAQPPKGVDVEKARQDLERATIDLEKAKAALQVMHAEMEMKAAQLKMAMENLKLLEKAQAQGEFKGGGKGGAGGKGGGKGGKGGVGGVGGAFDGFGGGLPGLAPAMERRMTELEQKLDQVLDEIREMRKSMPKGPGGDGPFGPKDGGKKGKGGKGGGFGGGGGGGFPGGPGNGKTSAVDPIVAPVWMPREAEWVAVRKC